MAEDSDLIRIQLSLLVEARKLAAEDGVDLDQWVNVAVAERVSAVRTAKFFQDRARGADVKLAMGILSRMGVANPVQPGDEMPD
jgi:hypothetical protein